MDRESRTAIGRLRENTFLKIVIPLKRMNGLINRTERNEKCIYIVSQPKTFLKIRSIETQFPTCKEALNEF